MADLLFPVKNNFYIGAFQTAISEASQLTGLNEQQKLERDVYTYRSYLEIGSYELVLSEIPPDPPVDLQAVRLLASYLKSPAAEKDHALTQASEWMEDPVAASNATALLVSAIIFALEDNIETALKFCHSALNLELMALGVQLALKLDRVDVAERTLQSMSQIDDDATLTQLAAAWVGLHQGGSKLQEAFYIYQELGDKFSWTVRLHNGLAACQMRMGRWEDAEAELLQAFEKNAKDADTLGNLVVVSLHLGKSAQRYITLLQGVAPTHALAMRAQTASELFEQAVENVGV